MSIIVTELHATFDFEYVIDMDKLRVALADTKYKVTDRGNVVWRLHDTTEKHFSHKAHARGAFTMKYVRMGQEEANAVFRELYPIYMACLGTDINESDGFKERNPERFKELRKELNDARKEQRKEQRKKHRMD